MKRNLILCAVAAVVLSACAKEIAPENSGFQNLKTVTFEADASSQTKTTLVDGTKVYWCAGDQIYVKGAPEAFTNALEGDETAASAAFTGEVEPADSYYAVYPYVESWDGNSAMTKLPVIQKAANGTFGNGYNITAAKTTSQLRAVIAEIKGDMQEVKAGIEKGWCDESEMEKVNSLMAQAQNRMGQVEDREATPQEENMFALASLM